MRTLECYDPQRAILEPEHVVKPVAGFPEIVLSTWSRGIVEDFAARFFPRKAGELNTMNLGMLPVYAAEVDGMEFGFYLCPVGAPAAAGLMEEVIAMGAKGFVFFGSCGVLSDDIPESGIVVPSAAVRDEGTSMHYLPPEDEIALDANSVAAVEDIFKEAEIAYYSGKTWTTDAIYRETPNKTEDRKARGCICVDMECAALAAVAKFRNVRFAQFLYAEDSLDGVCWQPRNMADKGVGSSAALIMAALEIAKKLRALPQ